MTHDAAFPLNRLEDIRQAPEDYRLLERVPFTREGASFPLVLAPAVGDEVPLVIIDFETTGLDYKTDSIIELGLVRINVSPSSGQVTDVVEVASYYEDPGHPIPPLITQITGITSDMVAGHRIDDQEVARWFSGNPIVVAHNADFDARFGSLRFPSAMGRARFACSSRGINWSALGFEGSKLEYLVMKHGGFYQGHRASIDCLAVAWLLHRNPEALKQLLASEAAVEYAVCATGAPFEVKDQLKERGYHWRPEEYGKVWRTVVPADELPVEQAFLSSLYFRGGDLADVQELTSRNRFR